MSAIHDVRETMGENIMVTATWAFEGIVPSAAPRDYDVFAILGDQRNSFNLTGNVSAPPMCHESYESSSD